MLLEDIRKILYVGFVQHRHLMIILDPPISSMSSSEECNYILQDVFDCDSEGMNLILEELCKGNNISYDWEKHGNEIDNLVIDNEDALHLMYKDHLDSNF